MDKQWLLVCFNLNQSEATTAPTMADVNTPGVVVRRCDVVRMDRNMSSMDTIAEVDAFCTTNPARLTAVFGSTPEWRCRNLL
jgi:hypothetical protein